MFSLAPYVLILSSFLYPSILLITWYRHKEISIGQVLKRIYTGRLPHGLNAQMIKEYEILIFSPNIIGTLNVILGKELGYLKIADDALVTLLLIHLFLIFLTSIGTAFLQMALNKTLLFFIGEIFLEWALIGGSLLFIIQILEILGEVNYVLSGLFISLISFF